MCVEQIPLAEKVIQHSTRRQPPVGTQPGASRSGSNSSIFAGMSISLMRLHDLSKDPRSINPLPSTQRSSRRRRWFSDSRS
jgi:hypothetical protein